MSRRTVSKLALTLLLLCSFVMLFEAQLAEVHAQMGGSIVINDGAAFTTSPSVTLTLTANDPSGVRGVMYSNDGVWDTEPYEPYFSGTKEWTLSSGDGVKTVYYRILDSYFDWSTSYSDTIVLDTLPPTGSIVINDGDVFAASPSVTLTLTANDAASGVDQVRFSNSGGWGSDTEGWESFSSTKSWSLSSGDGGKTVYYQIKDRVGSVSLLYSDTIVLDTLPPTGSIVINDGDVFAASPSVTLTLTANDLTSGVFRVRISNDGVWDTESWESFSSTKSWSLSSGDGAKTVYYQVSDRAGLDSTFSDTIVLDTVTPTGSIVINRGDAFATSSSVTLTLTANDQTSGVSRVRYSNDGVWDSESWESFSPTRTWSLPSGDGVKTVYYQISDNADLDSTFSDTILLDTAVPAGSIVINDGATFTSSASVTLTLTANDPASGVSRVRISNDGVWDTESWTSFSSTKDWTLSSGNGVKTVYYQIEDKAGHISSTYSDTITLSTLAPTGSIVINDEDDFTTSKSVTLSLTYEDEYSGVSRVRYSNDGVWNTEVWETPTATKEWTLTSGDGTKTVYYQIRNTLGFVSSTYSDTIVLDTTAPTGSIIINSGDASTTRYSVTLDLTANDPTSGVYQVRYSNDGVWDTESWENFSSTKEWTLSSGKGSKTVYYQIMDRAELVSLTFSDSIILENPSPTPTPTPTPTSTPTPGPTLGPTESPSNSPTPSPEPTRGTVGMIPPEAFYATAAIGIASIAGIVFVALKKPKSDQNADKLART